jgi:hypothetical protein
MVAGELQSYRENTSTHPKNDQAMQDQDQNKKQAVKKPSPVPMKNIPDKSQQKNKKQQQDSKNPGTIDPDLQENMGSGKRQDDN